MSAFLSAPFVRSAGRTRLSQRGKVCMSSANKEPPKSPRPKPKARPKPVLSFPGADGRIIKGYTLRVMQWNIDFDTDNVWSRTSHVIQIVGEEKPDVICLQEVSAVEAGPRGSSFALIKKKLVDTGIYELYADELVVERHPHYFAIMLVRSRILASATVEYLRFRATKMARHLIVVKAGLITEEGEDSVCLLTSHMESLPSGIVERLYQWRQILEIMRNSEYPAVFGGDTNLRFREVRKRDVRLQADENMLVPDDKSDPRVSDAWVQAGSPEDAKFSFDARVNDNKEWIGDARPYARFDRVFCYPGCNADFRRPRAMRYRLVGNTRGVTDQFPSDHFGIVVDFNMTLPLES